MHDRLTMKPAYALIPGDIFKPVREDGFTAQTAVWAKLTDIEELDNVRTVRLHTAEHGALAIPRYHRCYIQCHEKTDEEIARYRSLAGPPMEPWVNDTGIA